jgi:hypothetical protein
LISELSKCQSPSQCSGRNAKDVSDGPAESAVVIVAPGLLAPAAALALPSIPVVAAGGPDAASAATEPPPSPSKTPSSPHAAIAVRAAKTIIDGLRIIIPGPSI